MGIADLYAGAGQRSLAFALYFEPRGGIASARDFTDELLHWAAESGRDVTLLREGMEPLVRVDGAAYLCRLAEPGLATQNNLLWKAFAKTGVEHSVGRTLGYKWVYLYPAEDPDAE